MLRRGVVVGSQRGQVCLHPPLVLVEHGQAVRAGVAGTVYRAEGMGGEHPVTAVGPERVGGNLSERLPGLDQVLVGVGTDSGEDAFGASYLCW